MPRSHPSAYAQTKPISTWIWLFKDRESYTNQAWRLFRDTPTTPFGYYSAPHRALVMPQQGSFAIAKRGFLRRLRCIWWGEA
jgi:hypothetical protein